MKLRKVYYEFFESMMEDLPLVDNAETFELDKEVCLEFDGGNKKYISWSSEPVMYSVGIKKESWFSCSEAAIDVSNCKVWQPLINQSCEFAFLDKYHQVLEIKCEKRSVYISSYERECWYSDTLCISLNNPDFDEERDGSHISYEEVLETIENIKGKRDLVEKEDEISLVGYSESFGDNVIHEFVNSSLGWEYSIMSTEQEKDGITDKEIAKLAIEGKMISAIRLYRVKYDADLDTARREVEKYI